MLVPNVVGINIDTPTFFSVILLGFQDGNINAVSSLFSSHLAVT